MIYDTLRGADVAARSASRLTVHVVRVFKLTSNQYAVALHVIKSYECKSAFQNGVRIKTQGAKQ